MKNNLLHIALSTAFILMLSMQVSYAATRTASSSGNWNSTATWGGASVPTSADAVFINSGITVTVNIANAQCASLTFNAAITNSALVFSGTNSLSITGLLSMPRPSTYRNCAVNLYAGSLTCGSLTMSATTSGRDNIINITTGTLTVTGTISTGTTGCQINITDAGILNMGFLTGSPAMSTVAGCSVNYTGSGTQNIYAIDYNGNLGLSGNGIKIMASSITTYGNLTIGSGTPLTINSTMTAIVYGNIVNSGTITLIAGTSSADTWLRMSGNVTNNLSGTIDATADKTRFIFISTNAQTFTNNGTVTSPVSAFGVANSHASGLTLAGNNNTIIARANLFYGTVVNASKLTLGTGGTSSVIVQRGMAGNVSPAGSLDAAPVFNIGTGGITLYYDEASVPYSTGFEIPTSGIVNNISIYNTADVTMSGNLSVSTDLTFAGGTGTTSFSIGANTLTLNGSLTYAADPVFYGGNTSNLVLNSANQVKSISNGLNNLTVNANTNLAGAITVNGTLTLTSGVLVNSTHLTMANGSTISRSQGSLGSAPIFSGNVNLVYTGSSAITTGMEMPVSSGVLNNLTTNTGGVIQGGNLGSSVNILTDAFDNLNNWTGDLGASYNQYSAVSSSNAGGTSKECRYVYGASSTTEYATSIYRSVNTTGYTSLNISWKQFIDNYNATTWPYTIKIQCAASSSGPWTDIYSLSPTGAANIGPDNLSYSNWTTNVGGTFYIRFYITGYTYGLDFWYFDDLVIDGQSSNTPSSVTVNGAFNLSGGTYSISTNSLVLNGTVSGSNAIVGSTASNLSVGGSGSNLAIPAITNGLNNFTINRATGVTLNSNATVYGIFNLQSSNPSSTQGALHTGTNALTMGTSATTVGQGDVTGIVKRTTLNPNIPYSFGNQFTTLSFSSGGTIPSSVQVKISIGTAPAWKSSAIKRIYDFIQTGGSNCVATIGTHYLDSELNGNSENILSQWTNGTPGPPLGLFEWGSSNRNMSENWVEIANVNIENFPESFGQLENTLGTTDVVNFVWNGSTSTDWTNYLNWTPNGIPSSISEVLIPDASTTTYSPVLPASTELKTLTIAVNGIVNTTAGAQLTINGANGAWSNIGGTFNPGSGTVTFTNMAATLSGTTNFYNVVIASGKALWMTSGSTMRIGGSITNGGTWKTVIGGVTTVEYNGSSQTVLNPNGPTAGYYNLILSGSGIKTMPASALAIEGDFSISGSVSVTAAAAIATAGNVTINSGTTLNLSAYSHSIGGNLVNNSGTLTSSGSSITLNGSMPQSITSSAGVSFNDFTITNTSATVSLGTSTNCNIGGDLSISSGAVFDLAANSLTSITGSVSCSGTVITQSTSSTPVPAGKTWGGSFIFSGSVAQTIVAGTYNNLAISGSGGATANANITVNGILNLTSVNPSATKGVLDMGSNTLLMGPTSTTVGSGDVSGIVKRTTFIPGVTYSYGNQYTTINFEDFGTLPTELSLKITIGTSPSWKPGAINRTYELIQTGAVSTHALMYAHYLDSELNGNNEENLVDWIWITPSTTVEYGRSSNNTVHNWVSISNANIGIFYSVFGVMNITLDESETTSLTWNGSTSNSWVTAANWTPNAAPSAHTAITIPDAATTNFDPTIPIIASCGTMKLENGAVLNAASGAELTINDGDGAWDNQGATFNAGNSTIVLTNAAATMAGSTDFYNLTINAGALIVLEDATYLGISGALINSGTLRTVYKGTTTVEYKGGDQTVVIPNTSTSRYSTLKLSGSGTKTMPASSLAIYGDLIISGTATVTTGGAVSCSGSVSIGSGTVLNAGNYRHSISGNFTNDGIFSSSSGGSILMNGTSAQSIAGSSLTTFENLAIENNTGVTLCSNVNINDSLMLSLGNLNTGANSLGINGSINRTDGFLDVSTSTSLSFTGSSSITLPNDLFASTPVINNLTVDRSGGVTLGNQDMTVNGLLDLISGTLTIGANELFIAGSSPTLTSGSIDASNAGATLNFSNTSAITLPAGIFTGVVYNMDIDGTGGITVNSDFTINGILDLDNINPTSSKGLIDMWDGSSAKTLTMGADAVTIGMGDVSGIIKRTTILPEVNYTYGNSNTRVYFPNEGTLPTEMSVKVRIGSSPSWRAGAIDREIEVIQTGGNNTKGIFTMHYVDTELNGNAEQKLVFWLSLTGGIEYGRSSYNTTEDWVTLSNVNVGYFSSTFDGTKIITLDEYGTTTTLVWNGSVSDSWTSVENWTPNEGPSSVKQIIIPDATSTTYSPSLPSTTEIKALILESGAVLNSNTGAQLTINGSSDAWNNYGGTFNAGTSEVIFTNIGATISGITNFYNIKIDTLSELSMTSGCTMRIAGSVINKGKWHTVTGGNTIVEYNGDDQTVVVPNPDTHRYGSLVLSGGGTKTLPAGALSIMGDFSVSGTASTTAVDAITTTGDFDIMTGATFYTGTFNHSIGGNFSNTGTFTAASGNNITFNGTEAQTIGGTSTTVFNNITIDNSTGVSLITPSLTTVSGNLTINSGKKFIINSGRLLTVSGSVNNNAGSAGFVLKSDSSGTASLIQNSDNIAATVERFISGSTEAWHFISPSVSNQPVSGSWLPTGTYGNGTGYDLYVWNEPTNCWIYKTDTTSTTNWNTVHPTSHFVAGRGYLYSTQAANPTKSFIGNLNNGTISTDLKFNSSDASLKGFNLVGNPFPSSIDWQAATGWTRTDLLNSGSGYDMWIWNQAANNYGVCNSFTGTGTNSVTRYIAPMQGFFVRAANTGTLNMDNSVCVHESTSWFKNTISNPAMVSVFVQKESDNSSDEIRLQFGYMENQSGAEKLFSYVRSAPSLYTSFEGENYSVRYLSDVLDNPKVPVMFKPGTDGNYTLICNFDADEFETIMLEDKQMNYLQNVKDKNSYRFQSSTSDDVNRFVLHFGPDNASNMNELPARIYSDGKQLNIDLSLIADETVVSVYDALGRILVQKKLQGLIQHQLTVNVPPQILVVQLRNTQGRISRKLFYKNNY